MEREKRSWALTGLEKVNKFTLIGFLGVATVAALVGANSLVVTALGLAAVDAGQMLFIKKINRKPNNPQAA